MAATRQASRLQTYQKGGGYRARAQSVDSSTDTSWGIASEHESYKSLVVDDDRRFEVDEAFLDGPFRRAGLHRSFSFQGSSNLRSRYLSKVKPHLYRHPEDNWEIESLSFTRLSGHQRKTLSCIWAAKLSYFFALGMMPVVLPIIVEAKGLGSFATGTLFAVWGLATAVFWPFWQMAISKTGSKTMLILGLCLTGISYLLFGCLHFEPDWQRFIIISYILRVIEGAGYAAIEIAVTAKVLMEFPRHESGAYGSTQNCIGVGLTIGSCLGGFLYSVADVAASLITGGLLLFLIGFITICLLKKRPYIYSNDSQSPRHKRKFLRQMSVWVALAMLFFGTFALSCLIPILEPHLREIFTPHYTVEGIVLAAIPLSFAFGTAIWQWLITHDYICGLESVSIAGLIIAAVTLLLLGPSKAFNIPIDLLWLDVVCFLALGGAASMIYTSTINALLEGAELKKMNKLAAYSTITTMIVLTQSIALVIGAPIGGSLFQYLDFQAATSIISVILFCVCGLALLHCTVKCVLTVRQYRRLVMASEAEQAEARRTRTFRAPVMGASAAAASSPKPTILDRNFSRNSQFTASRLTDRRPLLASPTGKGRSYGTYL
ncbi:hypothetical protein BV898_09491 [Hypsibius exemplaris]|uniref:Major facilitator superfamily (MFS) profile domain-containing protein n=1 Tax=Hypsibius exemplaris TaxID=2072580 RepID=A0A1W0WMA2_HYPEX|nr:hypothetical protein BV898_09491 [Hypsibius exemplaris]